MFLSPRLVASLHTGNDSYGIVLEPGKPRPLGWSFVVVPGIDLMRRGVEEMGIRKWGFAGGSLLVEEDFVGRALPRITIGRGLFSMYCTAVYCANRPVFDLGRMV